MEFARRGFAIASESGRAVVRDHPELATATRTPDQQRRFAKLVWERDRRTLAWANGQPGPVIFDRTAVDNLGDGSGPDQRALAASVILTGPVALLPHWPDIYAVDAERLWPVEQALAIEALVRRSLSAARP